MTVFGTFSLVSGSLLLLACGGTCPDARHHPAEAAKTVVDTFVLQSLNAEGSLLRNREGEAAKEGYFCDKDCWALARNAETSCKALCAALEPGSEIRSCSFGPGRAAVSCTAFFSAKEESCSCTFIDC